MTQLTYANKPAIAFAGMKADIQDGDVIDTGVNAEAVALNYGTAVKQGASGDFKLLPTSGGKVVGVVLHDHAGVYNRDLSGVGGVPAAAGNAGSPGVFSCMRKGRVWALCRGGCAVNDPVFVQVTTNGARLKGDFCGTDDGANAEALSQAIWRSAAADNGLAILEVDFSVVLGAQT